MMLRGAAARGRAVTGATEAAGDGAVAGAEPAETTELPPICAVPALPLVELPLPFPTCTGAVVWDGRAPPVAADGAAFAPLTCPVPTESVVALPAPACTAPADPVAWFPPDPVTAAGAEAAAVAVSVAASTAGAAEVGPTWTVPTEPVTPFPPPGSAAAVAVDPRAAAAAAPMMSQRFIASPSRRSVPTELPTLRKAQTTAKPGRRDASAALRPAPPD
jgi:hypothetical protein